MKRPALLPTAGKRDDEGRFYARWRREEPCAPGRPFTYLRTEGRGHVVGTILQAQGLEPGNTCFFEMRRGENVLYLHLVGPDPRSKGLGFDLAEIVFERTGPAAKEENRT